MKIEPLGNRLLIEECKETETKTKGGIIIGDVQVPQSIKVKILAIGSGVNPEDKFKVGQVVFVSQFAPTETRMSVQDKSMTVPAEDVIARVNGE